MRCVVTNWDYMDELCRRLAKQVLEDGFEPNVIVALARGGWFVGSVLCDLLCLNDLVSLRVRHYRGIQKHEVIVQPSDIDLSGDVLIVDDLINTGLSMKKVKELVERKADRVKTACLLLLSNSTFLPDYFGEYLEDFVWVVFPWNFVEDISSLILSVMDEQEFWSEWELKTALNRRFGINPLHLEMFQPNRFREVLMIMERRGLIERVELGDRVCWRLADTEDVIN